MEGIVDLHHNIMFYILIVIIFILWMIVRIVALFGTNEELVTVAALQQSHHIFLEWAWTSIPSFILVLIAAPSFALLFSMDDVTQPEISLKVIGHQWYWSYEYSYLGEQGPQSFSYTANLVLEEDLFPGMIRLLETDLEVMLPARVHIRILVTSTDVLHS